ncbi:acyl-CoA synthetase [Enterovirga aerilata]|uniref:Acyl-CoA synthetase n=1 Tax=Enterovirga aerilata TaxID=2730920 RepID=A0A849I5V8_9HYPH|nr:acyl-CoA synthetase [Enterovirga sp. DB1703]NNM72711.1 acyl-CoA synthetase [Enterovirga sp. DB1703]
MRLTDLTSYADAQRECSSARLWELFDGNKEALNIAHECVDRHAEGGSRDRAAVCIAHADGRDLAITFGELSEASSRFAHWLESRGVAAGDRVAIMLEPSPAFYVALFGAMKCGAVAVPLFTLFGPEGLRLRVDDCGPRLIVTDEERAGIARSVVGPQVVIANALLDEELASFPSRYETRTRADDMAMYQYTSGTTRELPDAVKHTHRAIVVVMLAALYGTGVRPGDRYFCPSSPAWGHGLWHGTLAPLALGVTIGAYAGKFDPVRLLKALQDYEITNLSAAATHYRMMRLSGAAASFRYALRKLSYTGEPIDPATLDFVHETFGGVPVCSIYGTTEVGVILVNYPGAEDFPVKPGSLGKAVPGVKVEVHDAEGRPARPGQVGEIKVWRRDAWFPTKDLGHHDEDGYFYHNGRADDVIISAGWTMSAVEIENVLLKHPDVREAAVIGVPDGIRGQVAKAFVVAARDGDDFARELQDFTRTRLSQHEYPRRLAFVPELPKTPAGKVNRKVLRDRESAAASAAA